jgi:hypothetical protein
MANLATMGTGQVLLASVSLGSYALALGQFTGNRGRLITIAATIISAAGFVAQSERWEAGVIVMAFVPVGMGLFAAIVWVMWRLASGTSRPGVLVAPVPLRPALRQAAPGSVLERLRARLRFI